MTAWFVAVFLPCLLNVVLALFLSPLCEGIMRKLRAAIHSRIGPPITQPYWDLLKLLGKEDLRSTGGVVYASLPAFTLGSLLLLATLIPMGTTAPLAFAGDMIVVLYVAAMSAVLIMLTGFASASPYASIGSSREMMMLRRRANPGNCTLRGCVQGQDLGPGRHSQLAGTEWTKHKYGDRRLGIFPRSAGAGRQIAIRYCRG